MLGILLSVFGSFKFVMDGQLFYRGIMFGDAAIGGYAP